MARESRTGSAVGFPALLALGINGIIGVGIFFAPAEVAGLVPGVRGVAVYVLTAAALLPIAVTYATLGSRFGEDGGPYVWARAAFGPSVAYFVGWIAYVSALFSTSTVVSGLARFAGPSIGFDGPWGSRAFVVLAAVGLGGIVASGLRPSAVVWTAVTVLKVLPLLLLAALTVVFWSHFTSPAAPPRGPTTAELGRAALAVVFATQGFEIVPVPAGKARGGRRAVPAATIGSLLLAVALYVVLHLGCVRALPALAASRAPLAEAARAYGGSSAAAVVAAGTNVSALGICFGMFAMSPRYLFALGGGDALDGWLGSEDTRGVPQRSLWITVAVVIAFVLHGSLDQLFVLSSVTVLTQYAVSAAALGVLAWRGERDLRLRNLWPAPLALVAIVVIGRSATWAELVVAASVLAAGGLLLFCRRMAGRPRGSSDAD